MYSPTLPPVMADEVETLVLVAGKNDGAVVHFPAIHSVSRQLLARVKVV